MQSVQRDSSRALLTHRQTDLFRTPSPFYRLPNAEIIHQTIRDEVIRSSDQIIERKLNLIDKLKDSNQYESMVDSFEDLIETYYSKSREKSNYDHMGQTLVYVNAYINLCKTIPDKRSFLDNQAMQRAEDQKALCFNHISDWAKTHKSVACHFMRDFIDSTCNSGRQNETGFKEMCDIFRHELFEQKNPCKKLFHKSADFLNIIGKAQMGIVATYLPYSVVVYNRNDETEITAEHTFGTSLMINATLIATSVLLQMPKMFLNRGTEHRYRIE